MEILVDPQDRVSPGSTSRDGVGYAGSATRRFPYYTLDNPFHTIGYILPLIEDYADGADLVRRDGDLEGSHPFVLPRKFESIATLGYGSSGMCNMIFDTTEVGDRSI
jgi:hypothetical protein